eukprot:3856351-Prymnesium_polylepis.1
MSPPQPSGSVATRHLAAPAACASEQRAARRALNSSGAAARSPSVAAHNGATHHEVGPLDDRSAAVARVRVAAARARVVAAAAARARCAEAAAA